MDTIKLRSWNVIRRSRQICLSFQHWDVLVIVWKTNEVIADSQSLKYCFTFIDLGHICEFITLMKKLKS